MSPTAPDQVSAPKKKKSGLGLGTVIALTVVLGFTIPLLVLGFSEPQYARAQRDIARIDARVIQAAAQHYRSEHPSEPCPTMAQLRETRQLQPNAVKDVDPWDSPYKIVCGADIVVKSFGPDRTEGTADDIR